MREQKKRVVVLAARCKLNCSDMQAMLGMAPMRGSFLSGGWGEVRMRAVSLERLKCQGYFLHRISLPA